MCARTACASCVRRTPTRLSVNADGLAPFQLNNVAKGSSVVFTDGGAQHLNRSIHNVKLTGLQLATNYFYHVGDPELGWSEMVRARCRARAAA